MAENIDLLVRWFEASEEASQQGRSEAETCRDYYNGNQLSEEVRRVLRKRKQPEVIENLIRPKVDYLCGLERQSRTDPKAYPRTQAHEDDANAATDALRYVSDDQDIDIKRSRVFENMLVEGFGGVECIVHRARGGVVDPKIVHIPWDRIFYDPHSCAADFSDAHYLGFVTWMDVETAKAKYPDAAQVIDDTVTQPTSSHFETYDDKPKWSFWADSNRKRVRIVTCYYLKDDVWQRAVYTRAGEITPCGPSPFLDEDGKPECALILQAASVDRGNDRFGIVRDMLTQQDEVNKRRSKVLHLLTMRQVRVSPSASGGDKVSESIRNELARPDGAIVADKDEFEVLPTNDMTAGQFQLLQDTRMSLKGMGPNATMQGKSGQDQSGRAILALQQGGMIEMAPLLDNLRHFTLRLYRQVWNRIRQYWTDERWIRVTDDESNVRFVGVNVTQGHMAMNKIAEALKAGQIDEDAARQYAAQIHSDPEMMKPANAVAELDVDIDLDEVNETPTLQIEQFEQLVQLASSGMVAIPPDVIIQASNLRDKQKLLKMLKEGQAQVPPEIQQQIQEGTQLIQQQQAQIEELTGQVQDKSVEHKLKSDEIAVKAGELKIDGYRAETERMVAENPPQREAA